MKMVTIMIEYEVTKNKYFKRGGKRLCLPVTERYKGWRV